MRKVEIFSFTELSNAAQMKAIADFRAMNGDGKGSLRYAPGSEIITILERDEFEFTEDGNPFYDRTKH